MKKILTVLACACILAFSVVALVGCGDKEKIVDTGDLAIILQIDK